MIQVGYVSSHRPSSLPREERAAWNWLQHSPVSSTFFLTDEMNDVPPSLDACQVLWWHSTEILTPVNPGTAQTLLTFYENGGGLLLSLLAAPFVSEMGLEDILPDRILKGKWNQQTEMEGYPDIRGFHGILNHPLFEGLHGGVYTWMPAEGEPYCEAVYSRTANPRNGAVLALERGRISMNDDRKCLVEYRNERGIALTIGTHLYFSPSTDEFRRHRDVFMLNVFRYLSDPPSPAASFHPRHPTHAFSP